MSSSAPALVSASSVCDPLGKLPNLFVCLCVCICVFVFMHKPVIFVCVSVQQFVCKLYIIYRRIRITGTL